MKNQNENQEKYEQGRRTRPENVLHDLPDRLAIITINPYTTAIGFGRYGKAYLQVLNPDKVSGLQLQGNAIYESGKFQALTDKEIQNMTSTRYEMIDLGLLRMFYSIILKEYEKVDFEKNSSDIVLYVPDLFRALGKKMNQSQNQIQALVEAINQFKNVLGVVISDNGGRKYKSYYALLNFNYYDEERNVVSFSAPYLDYVVQTVHNASVRLDKNDRPMVAMHWEKYFQHIRDKYNSIYKVQMPKVTPHVCRHTFCSNMAKSGMNPKMLQYIMGHADISVTMNTYTHVKFQDAQQEFKKVVNE